MKEKFLRWCCNIPYYQSFCLSLLYFSIPATDLSFLILLSLSEILKLLAHCGTAPVNSPVKFPIVSAHQIKVIREKEHAGQEGEGKVCYISVGIKWLGTVQRLTFVLGTPADSSRVFPCFQFVTQKARCSSHACRISINLQFICACRFWRKC